MGPPPQEQPQATGDGAAPSPGPSRKKALPSLAKQRATLQKKKAAEKAAAKKQHQKDLRSQAEMSPKEFNHLRQREVAENAYPNVAHVVAQPKIVYAPDDIHHVNPRRLFEGDNEAKDPNSDGKMLFRLSEKLANQRLQSDQQASPGPGRPDSPAVVTPLTDDDDASRPGDQQDNTMPPNHEHEHDIDLSNENSHERDHSPEPIDLTAEAIHTGAPRRSSRLSSPAKTGDKRTRSGPQGPHSPNTPSKKANSGQLPPPQPNPKGQAKPKTGPAQRATRGKGGALIHLPNTKASGGKTLPRKRGFRKSNTQTLMSYLSPKSSSSS